MFPPVQPVVPLVQSVIPPLSPVQTAIPGAGAMALLNWSPLKPEYSCKPDEDTEAHLLKK